MQGKRFFCVSCQEAVIVFDEEKGRWCPVCKQELYKQATIVSIMPPTGHENVRLQIYNVPFCKN